MAEIISFDDYIDVSSLSRPQRKLDAGLIGPACGDIEDLSVDEHASEPIKNLADIDHISGWFISQERYRDNMLFIVGINFGLRVSDLLRLGFYDIINEDLSFKLKFAILEKKTSNTRKIKKNRWITINDAVIDAVTLYLEHTPGVKLSDYMFRSESNNGANLNKPMHRNSVERILKEAAQAVGLNIHVATHTLRKTFAYHQMLMSGNDPRKLLLLQKMFGHSTSAQTLDYIGITGEEIEEAYLKLNLGGRRCLIDSTIEENTVA